MTHADILHHRLIHQQIVGTSFKTPAELVSWMGAMQAQEYAQAKWAIGLRLPGYNDADVEQAFNNGEILRTHLMRPTWHFMVPEDIRWLTELTAPRVKQLCIFMDRKMELDDKIFKKTNAIISNALQGGHSLDRTQIKHELEKAKITEVGPRLVHILMRAELDGLICSGPRKGKQSTYALLEERVPPAKELTPKEALVMLTKKYFTSHGPATLQDFVWWSGLTVKDAKEGIAELGSEFAREMVDEQEYIFIPVPNKDLSKLQTTFLMPDYDEYGISYKDRTALFGAKKAGRKANTNIFGHMIVMDGAIAGTWRRTVKGKTIGVETNLYRKLNKVQQHTLSNAVKKYIAFTQG